VRSFIASKSAESDPQGSQATRWIWITALAAGALIALSAGVVWLWPGYDSQLKPNNILAPSLTVLLDQADPSRDQTSGAPTTAKAPTTGNSPSTTNAPAITTTKQGAPNSATTARPTTTAWAGPCGWDLLAVPNGKTYNMLLTLRNDSALDLDQWTADLNYTGGWTYEPGSGTGANFAGVESLALTSGNVIRAARGLSPSFRLDPTGTLESGKPTLTSVILNGVTCRPGSIILN
jgi:hypothetical protein